MRRRARGRHAVAVERPGDVTPLRSKPAVIASTSVAPAGSGASGRCIGTPNQPGVPSVSAA